MSGRVTRALKGSSLAGESQPGLQAIPSANWPYIGESLRSSFLDSLDLDEATRTQHPGDSRWDYLLGHGGTSHVVALETHPANTSNVKEVVRKRIASREHLQHHLQPGETVAAWYWVASGRIDFAPHDKTINHLDQNGIQFVGSRLETKHLASLSRRAVAPARRSKKPRK